MSDLERPVLYEDSCGIWLDSFNSEFEQINIIKSNLYNKKEIWIVSPELHGRDENQFWAELKNIKDTKNYYLCTDKPQKARDIFL